jgi:acetyl/propionyl-CoA carboxylase alpha subunit
VLGPAPAAESYLSIERLLAAAAATRADAVHPGYGFLSENPEFASACEEAGLAFIGPASGTIRALGSKIESRRIAERAGAPVVPGARGKNDAELLAAAQKLGWPVVVKASAGGGGKGMRVVASEPEFARAAAVARTEAEAAFGDGTIYVERHLARPRHVEIQVFGDASGRVWALGERECSVQRRHQKILEESPSPAVGDALRRDMTEAALRIAAEVRYRNAGTVEFLIDDAGSFHFLEMNTRLQVEHAVTEAVYGVDLVAAQILTAAGDALPFDPERATPRGHAIEARVYAEDPARGFLPQTGRVRRLVLPQGPDIRVDSGLAEGMDVPVHYDPLLAKIIAWGSDRRAATRRLRAALADFAVLGVVTNIDFLLDVLDLPAWDAGRLHTGFLDEHLPSWTEPASAPPAAAALAAEAALLSVGGPAARDGGPWASLGGWSPAERR